MSEDLGIDIFFVPMDCEFPEGRDHAFFTLSTE